MTDFTLPELGENITKGDIVKISVSVGTVVKKDQTLIELETDKAVVEVPSSFDGTITEIIAKVGDVAKVGQVILKYSSGSAAAAAPAKAAAEKPTPAPKETVATSAPVKPTPEPKPVPQTKAEPIAKPATTKVADASTSKGNLNASPSVRRLAREIGVDLAKVSGTDHNGRISEEDVKQYARSLNAQSASQPEQSATGPIVELPDFSKWGAVTRKPMSSVRRTTAKHLSQAWFVPHVTQFDKADITDLEKLRKSFSKRAEASGGKLTMTVIVLKIVASALKVFPQFNASIDPKTDEIIFKNYYNIGVAVDTDRGLLVPVIRNVEKKNILELSVDLNKAAAAARDKKLTLDDMQGGTFTISNLGGLGGTYFTPIINIPEVAILGLSRGQIEPVYIDGKFEPRLMLPLSLSYDHRLIDGADAIRFLRWIAEALQQPFLMDLEG